MTGWQHAPAPAVDDPRPWTICDWHPGQAHIYDAEPATADILAADRACESAVAASGALLVPNRRGDLTAPVDHR